MTITTVRKTYQLFDEDKQVWFDIYEAPGIEGRPITAEVPREVGGLKPVSTYLLSKGAEAAAVADAVGLAPPLLPTLPSSAGRRARVGGTTTGSSSLTAS